MRKYRAGAVVVVARPSKTHFGKEARARAGASVSEKMTPASRRDRPEPIRIINNNYSLEMSIQQQQQEQRKSVHSGPCTGPHRPNTHPGGATHTPAPSALRRAPCVTTTPPALLRALCDGNAPRWTNADSGPVSPMIRPALCAEIAPRVLPPSPAPCLDFTITTASTNGASPLLRPPRLGTPHYRGES